VEAGAAGAAAAGGTAVGVAGGAMGGTGRKSGPFWPQPASAAAPTTTAARPCLKAKAWRRP